MTLGVWIDEWEAQNEREIDAPSSSPSTTATSTASSSATRRLPRAGARAAGNRDANAAVQDLIAKIQRVKREVSVPVTTAEVWNIWLEHPELASAVDYLAVHILPYWEGLPSSVAVDHAIEDL